MPSAKAFSANVTSVPEKLRSLLLAAILLSNYLAWTATRHHHPHNLSRHRTRHRRQGAGLYLPASYVLPGGEGTGAWGEWGDVSPCSRTCGGGVASRKRICLEVNSEGKPLCTGGDTKYFSCQTQDCPSPGDFRSEQCSEYDDVAFRGIKYQWIPYTNAPNPCELNCMPRGERFYYRQKDKVIDGTRCNDESFDVCVSGTCQAVGCDMMLGSNAREDKCRECRGNGTNCHTVAGVIDTTDLRKGYNDVLLIPQGATSIVISEVRASNNYLALRAKQDNVYYLNGEYHIDFPRSLTIAGTLWHYERSQQGFAAPDKLRCLGPTTEPLYLSLLLQDENVGIEYEYSVPSSMAPPPTQQYNWVHGDFTPCSATCGGGIQTREVTCRSREDLELVEDNLCDEALKPATNQNCNTDPCPARWVAEAWGPCSKVCGEGGTRSRQVYCEKLIINEFPSIVADKECFELLGPKPELYQECNQNASCPTWFTGPWKPCDKLCGEGKQTRQVICHQRQNGKVEVFEDESCEDEKPATEQSCMLRPCDGVDWVLSDWSGCDTCTSKVRTRIAHCATKDHKVVDPSFCSYHPTPLLEETCDRTKLPSCEVLWYATQWSKCSVECGKGVQSRRVFCGLFDGASVIKVDDERCDINDKYNDTKPCEVASEKCAAKWYAGPWSECTKDCGGGEQYRRVMCLSGGVEMNACPEETILETLQSCNTAPCDKTQTKTTESTSDEYYDYEECVEEDDYPEVGAEELIPLTGSTIFDTMLSDSPFTDEGSGSGSTAFTDSESEFTLDTGSGSEPTGASFWTEETGSGSSTAYTEESTEFTSITVTTESTIDDYYEDISGEFIMMKKKVTDTKTSKAEEVTAGTSDSSASSTDSSASSTDSSPSSTDSSTSSTDSSTSSTEGSTSYSDSSSTTSDSLTTTSDTSTETSLGITSTSVTESAETTDSYATTDVSETESDVTTDASTTNEMDTTTIRETDISSTEGSSTTSFSESDSTDITVTESLETTDLSSASTETELTDTTETSSTEGTSESSSTSASESTIEETGTTESTEYSTTEATVTTVSGSSETTELETDVTTETEGSTTTESGSSGSTESTEGETTLAEFSTTAASTEKETPTSESTEKVTTLMESSVTAVSTESELTSTVESVSTTSEASATTESSETSVTEGSVTTENFEKESTESSTTEKLDISSTASDQTETATATESVSTSAFTEESTTSSGSSTEASGSSTESTDGTSTTESSATDASTSESSTVEMSTLGSSTTDVSASGSSESSATELSTTGITESTVTDASTTEISATEGSATERGSTPWDWTTTVEVYTAKPSCKARKKVAKCLKSKFGCCPDKRTPAAGPFDEGCPNPKTCKETKYGCCPDGVSPASGLRNKGCPISPCADTLYGCCLSDNITAAEGNDQDGCPPAPSACTSSKYGCCDDGKTEATGPARKGCPETEPKIEKVGCESSEFGCCADNQTEATGPNEQGCPCNATEFGCCPDGVSPAQGSQMEGCVKSCNSTAYGCCLDGETPAHGPEYEGCCLQYPFGCCPDNYKPAEGPHLEGCGCEYSHFGCCPDNVTIARGPAKEGCGCQYSQFGCCPDRHTAAQSAGDDACPCSTYQFGCCPDGVTFATGPKQQGCSCESTPEGCCGDGVTPALGPNQLGCSCAASKYGCCPDGKTEAKGSKFLGCTDAPENRQAACSLTTDRGPCRNYTVQWYYDMEYGGCSRFWYGGCEGNGNRFASQEECVDVCEKPAPKDACKLPKVKGACVGYHLRWYFDTEREQCGQFVYGGCLGNQNNFDSRELCQKQCEPDRSDDQCSLPIEPGPCAGTFGRWGFNAERGRCEQFMWGGCEGNTNRFSTEAACMQRCQPPGSPQPVCALPQEAGNCTERYAAWSFSQTENRCVPFYYTGCGGNGNRFDSERACAAACPSAFAPDICTLPAETGECADYTGRWYYDTTESRCKHFYYGGCGGNENSFGTQQECEARCSQITTTTTEVPEAPEPYKSDNCFLELDPGPCDQLEARWGYDPSLGGCTIFQYGGCGGNRNNFPSREHCEYFCASAQDICQLPMRSGPCDDSLMRWFYDPVTDSCSQFTYGGCDGNDNRFESLEACERRCRTGGAEPVTSPTTTTTIATTITESPLTTTTPAAVEVLPQICQVSPILEECVAPGTVWYLDAGRRECLAHDNSGPGASCRNSGAFASQEACERSCGAFRNIEVCRYPVDPGPCRSFEPKFYFDESASRCDQFMYGGCHGGPNRFSSLEECEEICKPQSDPCKQRPEPGNCLAYLVMWYYDETRDECNQFVYGGCNGNDNRFDTREQCERRCVRTPVAAVSTTSPIADSTTTTTTTTTTVAPTTTTQEIPVEEECRTPESLQPCGGNATVFYYDSSRRACLVAEFGNCRYSNSYRSEEECERRCGAFRGLDVCGSRLDPGPCQETGIMKLYWEASTGSCQPFAYGGCLGGPNRFSSVEECEEVCGPTGPDSNEVLPDCDAFNEECAALRCAYGVQRTRTATGCERCSCVQVEIDCEPLRLECERLKCNYGMVRSTGDDGCERCKCLDHPCASKQCAEGERCVPTVFRDPVLQEISYIAGCNIVNKTGTCPSVEDSPPVDGSCRRECNDDADCRGAGKCCERGCSQLCLAPAEVAATSPAPHPSTYASELAQAPQASAETEPEVTANEGGKATLRCLFHSNPPPKITWRRGEITIDGETDRYRLLSDGALEIVSLYRNDTGVYICIADNGLGTARQEIRLVVNDPVATPVGIAGEENAVITGEIGRVLNVRCMVYGYPMPIIVVWYRGLSGPMVPFSSSLYEARGSVLQIRRLDLDTLGEYACQAYNGVGKPASWSVVVKAYRPDGDRTESQYLVDRHREVLITPREPQTESTTTPLPEITEPVYTVPVTTRILTVPTTIAAGAQLSLPCEVDGYPEPEVYWTKDGVPLSTNDRMLITESRLTITSTNINDSGLYGCHARNSFSSHSSTLQINVEGLYIPPTCTDNPFFANCHLIVRSKFCTHKYYSKFCCRSCVEAGLLSPQDIELLVK
ncbi:unnamed protein product, partial [Iphiclides podalirius]